MAELVGEIIRNDPDPKGAVVGLIGVATCMARYFDMPTRITIAGRLQDEARALRGLVH